MKKLAMAFLVAAAFGTSNSYSQEKNTDTQSSNKETRKPEGIDQDITTFAGLKFGVGLSLTHDYGSRKRVTDAQIINGIVRVTEENDTPARILLESHYFFQGGSPLFNLQPSQWGWGPFVAIQPGSNNIVEAIGFGIMIGFKRSSNDATSSWNVGMGLIADPQVRVLGDGFSANAPPPAGETEVRYSTKNQAGQFIMTSFTW